MNSETYVIVGIDANGSSRFGTRNVPESGKDSEVARHLAAGWLAAYAIPERF